MDTTLSSATTDIFSPEPIAPSVKTQYQKALTAVAGEMQGTTVIQVATSDSSAKRFAPSSGAALSMETSTVAPFEPNTEERTPAAPFGVSIHQNEANYAMARFKINVDPTNSTDFNSESFQKSKALVAEVIKTRVAAQQVASQKIDSKTKGLLTETTTGVKTDSSPLDLDEKELNKITQSLLKEISEDPDCQKALQSLTTATQFKAKNDALVATYPITGAAYRIASSFRGWQIERATAKLQKKSEAAMTTMLRKIDLKALDGLSKMADQQAIRSSTENAQSPSAPLSELTLTAPLIKEELPDLGRVRTTNWLGNWSYQGHFNDCGTSIQKAEDSIQLYSALIKRERSKVDKPEGTLPTNAVENSAAYLACMTTYSQAKIDFFEAREALKELAKNSDTLGLKEKADTALKKAQATFQKAEQMSNIVKNGLDYSNANRTTANRAAWGAAEAVGIATLGALLLACVILSGGVGTSDLPGGDASKEPIKLDL